MPGRVSLSITLAAAIGGLVAVAVSLVLLTSLGAARRNTLDLLADKAGLLLTLAESRLRGHLDAAEDQVIQFAELIREGNVDPGDRQQFLTAMYGSMAAVPQVLTMLYWDGGDELVVVARVPGGRLEQISRPLRGFDEKAQIEAGQNSRTEAYWADLIYVDEHQGWALNLRHTLRSQGRRAGVLAAIVSTAELSRFLTGLDGGVEGGVPFILYGDDLVLAHPYMAAGRSGLSEEGRLPTLLEVGDPLLSALWTHGERTVLEGRGEVETSYIDLDAGEQVMLYRRLEGYGDEPLILGIRFPESSVSRELERMAISAFVGLALLVLAVLVGIYVGRRIARPVVRLAGQASQIARLDLGGTDPLPRSVFAELDDQANAFNKMLAGLKWFETYVPRSLVRRLMAKQAGEDVRSVERELTVLFTDVAGFTSASEDLPAAETAGFLNHHFALLAGCIEAEGGTIDKFIGDAVMAFWGAPDRQPDHAERACRAALAMAAAIRADNGERAAQGRAPVRMRIGVHSGVMVVGNIGAPERMNYTIVGDAVNTGNRIEQLSKALAADQDVSILISGTTAAQLDASFDLVSRGRHTLRGRQEAIEIFQLR